MCFVGAFVWFAPVFHFLVQLVHKSVSSLCHMRRVCCLVLVVLSLSGAASDHDGVIDSVWVEGAFNHVRGLARVDAGAELAAAIDQFFEPAPVFLPVVLRGGISLRPVVYDYQAGSVGGVGSVNATALDGGGAWAFNTVIMLPPLSCTSVAKMASLFDSVLRYANPDISCSIDSLAMRYGAYVCELGECPCDDSSVKYETRVLVIETRCCADQLALPTDDEFPFVFDARTDLPPPMNRWKKRGRVLYD